MRNGLAAGGRRLRRAQPVMVTSGDDVDRRAGPDPVGLRAARTGPAIIAPTRDRDVDVEAPSPVEVLRQGHHRGAAPGARAAAGRPPRRAPKAFARSRSSVNVTNEHGQCRRCEQRGERALEGARRRPAWPKPVAAPATADAAANPSSPMRNARGGHRGGRRPGRRAGAGRRSASV